MVAAAKGAAATRFALWSLLAVAPLGSLAPSAAMCLLSISFNLLADAVSTHLTRGEAARMVRL